MSTWMLDSAFAPSMSQAQQAKAAGVTHWAGYTPAPKVYHAWSKADFDVIRQAGMEPVFVYVGTDGADAARQSALCGAVAGSKVAIDIEAGWSAAGAPAFSAAVRSAGFKSVVYGLDSVCDQVGASFDFRWRARYVYPTVPTPNSGDAIQYWNSHSEFGVGVDRNVCAIEWYTGDDTVTPAQEQGLWQELAFQQYVDVLVRVPESVDAMNARAGRIATIGAIGSRWEMATSPEGQSKPGGFVGAFQALQARVAALEAHVTSNPTTAYDPSTVNAEIAKIQSELAALHAALAAGATATQ